MLKRINIQPIEPYLQKTDSNPKNKNTYLQKMQKMKANDVKNNYKDAISRRGSTKSQALQIYNWIKQDTDQSQTQPTYQDKISNNLDIEKYTKNKIKQKQWISSSCSMNNKKIQKQQSIQVVEQLQPAVVQTLNQFIEYCLQNGRQKQKIKQQLTIEMSNNPLSNIQKILNQAHGQLQLQINKKKVQQLQQIQQIDRQSQYIQLQILMLINKHTQYRELLKNISNMQKQITITQQQANKKYKNRQQQICTNINILQNNKKHIKQQIQIYNNEIHTIISLKQKINKLQQQLQLNKKDSIYYNKLYKQLKGQKALSTIKTELNKNYRTFRDGKLQLSNKQILQQFYQIIRKKIVIIKNTINTNYEIHKFVADLEQQQNQKQGSKITVQSNKLTKDQLLWYNNNQFQYKIYCEYLKNDSEIYKIQSIIETIGKNNQINLNKIKMQVENVKKQANEQVNAINQLETMEKIRQAQIIQLQQILKQKKEQINRLGILEVPEYDSFDIFRPSRAGIKKNFIENQNFKFGKNKF